MKTVNYLKRHIWKFILALILISIAGHYISNFGAVPEAYESEMLANVQIIQIALERYAEQNNDEYPATIETLILEGYIKEFPINALDRRNTRPMKNITLLSDHSEGDFTYLPVIDESAVVGYYLVAYGWEKPYKRKHIHERVFENGGGASDKAIFVINSPKHEELGLPSFSEYLEELKKRPGDGQEPI